MNRAGQRIPIVQPRRIGHIVDRTHLLFIIIGNKLEDTTDDTNRTANEDDEDEKTFTFNLMEFVSLFPARKMRHRRIHGHPNTTNENGKMNPNKERKEDRNDILFELFGRLRIVYKQRAPVIRTVAIFNIGNLVVAHCLLIFGVTELPFFKRRIELVNLQKLLTKRSIDWSWGLG